MPRTRTDLVSCLGCELVFLKTNRRVSPVTLGDLDRVEGAGDSEMIATIGDYCQSPIHIIKTVFASHNDHPHRRMHRLEDADRPKCQYLRAGTVREQCIQDYQHLTMWIQAECRLIREPGEDVLEISRISGPRGKA